MSRATEGQKILRLTLKKAWFDMIASGKKTEEYREIKPWSTSRLMDKHKLEDDGEGKFYYTFRKYDLIEFKNGYGKNAPVMVFKFRSVCRCSKPVHWEWGEPSVPHYVIGIGERVS